MSYEFTKTVKKFLWVLGEILVAGSIVYFSGQPAWIGLVPVFEGLRNWLKHRND